MMVRTWLWLVHDHPPGAGEETLDAAKMCICGAVPTLGCWHQWLTNISTLARMRNGLSFALNTRWNPKSPFGQITLSFQVLNCHQSCFAVRCLLPCNCVQVAKQQVEV
jgi:hypothetical protein